MTDVLEVTLKGGLLLGGGATGGLHDATVRDGDGLPFLPASALKGAIREQLARLVDAERVQRILGGPGVGSADEDAVVVEERFGGGSTRVYLGDGVLVDAGLKEWFARGLGYARKTQVSIGRRSGRAADQLLFQREILAPFASGIRFKAPIDLSHLEPAGRGALTAAVSAVFALGAGRTAGLGGVEMMVRTENGDGAKPCKVPDSRTVELVLEAMDPLCLGADRASGNFHRTLGHLPASTLRGAVVTAALRVRNKAGVDQSGDPEFVKLVLDPQTCLRFSDARPGEDAPPLAAPVTLRTCKTEGHAHGVVDTLIRDFLIAQLAQRGVYVVPDESCPVCGERLIVAPRRLGRNEPERRVVTRLGLHGPSARGADGQLFSLEVLERGTRFVATVMGVGETGRALLADASLGVLRTGHGRGQGYGRMRIVDARPAPDDDLAGRLGQLDGWVREGLRRVAEALGASATESGRHYLAVTLATDLIPTSRLPAEDAVAEALGLDDVEIVYGQVRTGQRGGWDARRRAPKPYEGIVRAGSALLLRTEACLDTLRSRLAELEDRGAGKAREEGYGWVRFSDPVHSPQWRSP